MSESKNNKQNKHKYIGVFPKLPTAQNWHFCYFFPFISSVIFIGITRKLLWKMRLNLLINSSLLRDVICKDKYKKIQSKL